MPISDDKVQIILGGLSYQNWFEIDIDSDIFTQADAFSFKATIPPEASVRDAFREGTKCDVYIGRDRQMAGVIDNVKFTGNRSASRLDVSGRDRVAYLVDNETKHIKPSKYTVKTLIEALLDPSFGIRSVIFSNEENRNLLLGKKDKKKPVAQAGGLFSSVPRQRTKVDPGQRLAAVIDTHTNRLGITWWLTAEGDLFLGKPNYKQEVAYKFQVAAVDSAQAKNNNVLEWTVERSINDRYSQIDVVGQGWSQTKSLFDTAKEAPKYKGTATDPDLQQRRVVRKTTISDSDITSSDEASKRATLEMGKRRLHALKISLTVPGFRQGDRLFATDTLASVRIEEAGIDGTYYVVQRRFTEGRNQQRTSLTLHEKNVWLAS